MGGDGYAGQADAELQAHIAGLESRTVPLRAQLEQIRSEIDAIRTELRRRARLAQLERRKAARAEMAAGHIANLEDWVSAVVDVEGSGAFEDYRFLRESATEVRLGYASSARQSLGFTDGRITDEAADLAAARDLYGRGWEFGTVQARGVRIYPAGSRAERVVPATEIHVEPRAGD